MIGKTAIAAALAITLVFGGGVARAAPSPADTARSAEFYENARALFDKGAVRAAVIQLRNALQRNSRNLSARLLLGRAYLRLGNGAAAESQLKSALTSGADRVQTIVALGRAYMLQGKYKLLLEEIRTGTGRPDIEVEVLFLRGQAHVARRDFVLAREAFDRARAIEPDHVETVMGLARLELALGAPDKAAPLAARAAALAPGNADSWYLSGEVARAQRDFAAALGHYNKAIERAERHIPARLARAALLIDRGRHLQAEGDVLYVEAEAPNHPRTAYLHALIFDRQGNRAETRDALRRASRALEGLSPDDLINHPPTMLMRGVISYARRQYDEAYLFISRYVELVPHHVGARKILGTLLLRRGLARAAIEALAPAVARAPDDIELLALLGNAYMRGKEYKLANKVFEKAAAMAPDAKSIRTRLALSRLALGQRQRAIDDLDKAVSLDGRIGSAGVVLGLVQLRDGAYMDALETARRLSARNPGNPFPHNLAGAAYLQQNKYDEARASFEAALKISPDYRPARFNLAAVDSRQGRFAAAKTRLGNILKQHPTETRAMAELAKVAEREGDIAAAINWLTQFRKIDGKSLPPQLRLIELLLRLRQTREAMLIADELETAHPRNFAVLEIKARAQIAAGQTAKAIATFRQASYAGETTPAMLLRIARNLTRLGDHEGARSSLKSAISRDPDFLPAHSALVALEARLGGVDEALAMATALRAAYPNSAVGDLLTGDLLTGAGRHDEAIAAYLAARTKTDTAQLAVRLYNARRKGGDARTALDELRAWDAANPGDRTLRRALAAAYMTAGDVDRAIGAHEAIARENPKDAAALNNLALLYLRKDDPRALETARRAWQLAPTRPALLDTYGWVLVQHGKTVTGLRYLRDAQARASTSPEGGYHVAVALNRLGRLDEARRELERVLDLAAPFREADAARALLDRLSKKN